MEADKSKKISEMFRFGMQLRMPVTFNEVEYYGRGPGENYADRNHGAMIGKYRQTVEEQFIHTSARRKPERKQTSVGGTCSISVVMDCSL